MNPSDEADGTRDEGREHAGPRTPRRGEAPAGSEGSPVGRGRAVVFLLVPVALLAGAVELLAMLVGAVAAPALGLDMRPVNAIHEQQRAAIRYLLDAPDSARTEFDPVLGWRYQAGHATARERISLQGLRGETLYDARPAPGTTRVAAFGDSFVHGAEVTHAEAWSAQTEALHPSIEILNYGVGGYGTDQAYLRFLEEGTDLSPHIVIIGFHPVDLRRTVNVYRPFISTHETPLAKPRFTLTREGDLRLVPNPLPHRSDYERLLADPGAAAALGDRDKWFSSAVYENPLYDRSAAVRLIVNAASRVHGKLLDPDRLVRGGRFSETSSAFELQMAIFEHFVDDVEAAGALPLIVIFPDAGSIEAAMRGQKTVYSPLVERVRRESWAVVDLVEAFVDRRDAGDLAGLFAPGGHYSPEGNRIVAEHLGEILLELGSQGPEARTLHRSGHGGGAHHAGDPDPGRHR